MGKELNDSNSFYLMKGYAIISVIIAHTAVLNSNPNQVDKIILPAFGSLGLLGVPCFFLISGYYFYNDHNSIHQLFLKKLKSIVVPWIFCGTFVYFISSLFGSNNNAINVRTYFMFILGNGSLFYYLPLLLLYYFVFYFMKIKIEKIIILIATLNLFSLVALNNVMNPYLNPLNFMIFFAFGLVIKKYDMFTKLISIRKQLPILLASISFFMAYISYFSFDSINGFAYFKLTSVIYEFLGITLLFAISTVAYKWSAYFINLGKISFSIYLLHMPFAGAVNLIFSRFSIPIIPLKSVIVLVLCYSVLECARIVFDRFNLLFLKRLVGMR